jgi:hypothetical protein
LQGLDGLSEGEALQVLGEPEKNYVLQGSAKGHDKPTVPQYLVSSVDWEKVPRKFIAENPYIIDFGQSFYITKPLDNIGLPAPYRSPELLLEKFSYHRSGFVGLGLQSFRNPNRSKALRLL